MAKEKEEQSGTILNFILIAAILLTTLLLVGAGCEQQQPEEEKEKEPPELPEPPQIEVLFSDDFTGQSPGATPKNWKVVIQDRPTIAVISTTQKNKQIGQIMSVKGRMVTAGDTDWKDYTISTDFKVVAAADGIGPEIAFYMSEDADAYYLLQPKIGPKGVTYTLFRVSESTRYELKKRVFYEKNINDNSWHTLELSISMYSGKLNIDDMTVFEFDTDGKISKGKFGFGTDPYSNIYFDNVAILVTK